jgi:sec-independent protein translocase protein TatA
MNSMLALGMPGATEWIIIGIIGLLLFGKRLPEVGRSLGKGIVEFKKGLKGIEDDVESASSQPPPRQNTAAPGVPAPKFDPYTGKPLDTPPGTT